MRAHCLDPMHTLLSPISRNSILLLRPNHQILFPGNFYPFMWLRCVAMRDESSENVAPQITGGGEGGEGGKKSSLSRSRFQAISPGFISESSGVENSILKEKWRGGGGESWMKKKRGVYGVIIQLPPPKKKKTVFLLFLSHVSSPRMQVKSKISHDEGGGGGGGSWLVLDERLINI